MMPQLTAIDVEGCCPDSLRFGLNFGRGHEDEFGLRIDELFDEPRTRNSVDLDLLTGNPLHVDTFTAVFLAPGRPVNSPCAGAVSGLTATTCLIRKRVNCTFDPPWRFLFRIGRWPDLVGSERIGE